MNGVISEEVCGIFQLSSKKITRSLTKIVAMYLDRFSRRVVFKFARRLRLFAVNR